MRSDIDLGLTGERPALLDLEELLATRLLVQGNSGSGKSHLLRRLLEQSAGLVQQAIIDPEGDFVSLAERYGHVVVDGDGDDAELERDRRPRAHSTASRPCCRSRTLDAEVQMRAAAAFLDGAVRRRPRPLVSDAGRRSTRRSSSRRPSRATSRTRRASLSLGAMTNLMCRGRKRGLAGIIATQRLAKLAKNVAAEASNFLMGRTFLDIDMARAADLLGLERRQAETFRDLPRGHFVALGPGAVAAPAAPSRSGRPCTVSRSASPVLVPLPEPDRGCARADPDGEPAGEPARRFRPVRSRARPAAPDVLVQLANYRPPAPAEEPEEEPMDPEAREAALAEVLASVLADADAAACTPATLYQDFTVRCRIRRLRGDTMGLPEFKRRLAVARAEAGGAVADNSGWERAQGIAAGLPDDLAGLFLVVARAAIEGAPCPTDAMLAEAYGTSSGGRARRMLAYLEERGAIVTRKDLRGAPIIAVPDLGVETGAGRAADAADGAEAAGGVTVRDAVARTPRACGMSDCLPSSGRGGWECAGMAGQAPRRASSLASSTAARSSISAMSPSSRGSPEGPARSASRPAMARSSCGRDPAAEDRGLQPVEAVEQVVAALGRAAAPLLRGFALGLKEQDRVEPRQRRCRCRGAGARVGLGAAPRLKPGPPSGRRVAATPPAFWIGWRVSTRMIRFALLQAPLRRTGPSVPMVKRR